MNLEQTICVQICALLLYIQLYRQIGISIYIVLEGESIIKDVIIPVLVV